MITTLLIFGTLFLLYKFVNRLGKEFPLFELVGLLYFLQYGLAPLLLYEIDPINDMSLPKDRYLLMATLSCYAFVIGLFTFKSKTAYNVDQISTELASNLGRLLVTIGLASSFAALILPESLRSILNFFILLKTIGVFLLVFSDSKLDKTITFVVFAEVAFSAIINALLIEFIIFSVFFFMFFSLKYKLSVKSKLGLIVAGLLFITVYQGIKKEFRDLTWATNVSTTDKIAILTDLVDVESVTGLYEDDISGNESFLSTVRRLNQGWQTSMVYAYVPEFVPFEEGRDLLNDIASSIMPRFLWPNKRMVNDPDRFEKYTGYALNEITSMSIGVFGDFYINFGFPGTLLALYIFGVLASWFLRWYTRKFINQNLLNMVWLPFIFSYFIRPGNEFYMVLNHIIKALIVFYLIRKFVYPMVRSSIKKQYKLEA